MNSPAPSTPHGRRLPRWIKAIALLLLLLGIGFRSTNLDLKPFWEDEVYTITRVSGYRLGIVFEQINQQRVTVGELEKYRDPQGGRSWGDMMAALTTVPEHTPLYFIILRAWSEIVGHSTTALRALSAVFSVIGLGVFYLLGRSLFPTDSATGDAAGWGTMTLASLSPVLLRYAQETRAYSLWIIWLGLSTWALLRAWRSPSKPNWSIYGLTLVLAFYTHLLTLFVIGAHGIALLIHGLLHRWQHTPLRSWLLSTLASGVLMAPWLVLILSKQDVLRERTRWLTYDQPLRFLIRAWGDNFSNTWLEMPIRLQSVWYLVALAGLIGVAIATVHLWRHSPPSSIVPVLSITLVPALIIVAMDILAGGQRSIIRQYFLPAYMGLLTLTGSTLGSLLAGRVGQRRLSVQTLGLWSGTALILLISTLSMGELHRASTWWNKSSFIPAFTRAIAQEPPAILVTDHRLGEVLSLTYALPADQTLMWINPYTLKSNDLRSLPLEKDEAILLFTPSERLDKAIKQQRPQPHPKPIKGDFIPTLQRLPASTAP
ncbi:MAG: glycosyltransferase family 39 protein [Cyanobacteria bacterium P01_H01_bin.130]